MKNDFIHRDIHEVLYMQLSLGLLRPPQHVSYYSITFMVSNGLLGFGLSNLVLLFLLSIYFRVHMTCLITSFYVVG